MKAEIREMIIARLQDRLRQFGIRHSELHGSFDLVQSGLVNSVEFVDLVAMIEESTGIEIDYEKALEEGDFTTIGGIIRNFEKFTA